MEDGSVKTQEGLRKAEEMKAKREAATKQRKEEEAYRKSVMESTREIIRKEEEQAKAKGRVVDVQRRMRELTTHLNLPKKTSKKQLEKQDKLKRLEEPVPPKPVLPEGVILTLVGGEEDWISMWDLDDAAIIKRINQKKKEEKMARKHLRKVQAEQKKVNKAMKIKKKQYANAGVIWDPEKVRAEILGSMPAPSEDKTEPDSDADSESESSSDSDSDSGSNSSSDSESDDETEETKQPKKKNIPFMKPLILDTELLEEAQAVQQALVDKKKAKRTARRTARKEKETADEKKAEEAARLKAEEEEAEGKDKARAEKKAAKKAAKEAIEEAQALEAAEALESKKRKRDEEDDDEAAAAERKKARKEEKKAEKKRKHKENIDVEAKNQALEKAAKKEEKRKRKAESKVDTMDIDTAINGNDEVLTKKLKKSIVESNDEKLDREIAKREAKRKVELGSDEDRGPQYDKTGGTAQWNPDALSGGSARKDKFLKLLGAKKGGQAGKITNKPAKANGNVVDISKIQSELERQFESGIKMKHDGGSKRRGLGA